MRPGENCGRQRTQTQSRSGEAGPDGIARSIVILLKCLGYDVDDHVFADRFGEHTKRMLREGATEQVVIAVGRDQYGGYQALDLPDDGHGLQPGKTGKVHVHEGKMDFVILDDVDGLLATLGEERAEALRLEDIAKRLSNIGVIVSDEYRVGLDQQAWKPDSHQVDHVGNSSFVRSHPGRSCRDFSRPPESRISYQANAIGYLYATFGPNRRYGDLLISIDRSNSLQDL